jgi:DNA polymerase I
MGRPSALEPSAQESPSPQALLWLSFVMPTSSRSALPPGMPPKTVPRLFLIDAYALIYRAFHALAKSGLKNRRGENTAAPRGFADFLIKIRDQYEPDYLAVVFDAGMSGRELLYPAYKANRPPMPEDLAASLPRIREMVAGFRDEVVELDGYEADDVIGTLARQAVAAGIEAVIVSGDKDFYQLIGPHVNLLNPGRGGPSGIQHEWVDASNASERLGIPPEQVIDYLALIGDGSDNVPGAPGIGPKTAVPLLQEYGSLDALIEAAPSLKAKRPREALTEHEDLIRLSRQLVTIRTDLPIALDLDRLRVQEPDADRLRRLFSELEFRTLADRFAKASVAEGGPTDATPSPQGEYQTVTDPVELARLLEEAAAAPAVAVDTETTSLAPMEAHLVGISLSWAEGRGIYLPLAHRAPGGNQTSLLDTVEDGEAGPVNLPPLLDPAMAPLVAFLESQTVRKTGQNLKYDLLVLRRAGVELGGVAFDTMVASYVLDPGRRNHGLDALSVDLLGHRPLSYGEVTGTGKQQIPFAEVPVDLATRYAAEDADLALRLRNWFEPQLMAKGLGALFQDLEMPLVHVLAGMEWEGIRIDPEHFGVMRRKLARDLRNLEEEIWKEAGGEFNINSNHQLREILFDRLGLPVLRKTKTGASTDASVLEELAEKGHRLPGLLMEYRQLEKLRSTYVDALPRLVNSETGRIHTSFNQTVAATGRLSSSDPNLQNIPIRTPLGREIRKGFVADPGNLFLAADYSQIELRILAHFSGDQAFVEAFQQDRDVHRQTAASLFEVPIEAVTPEQRGRAKTINFATLYGQGDFSLARQLGITREEASTFIARYFERFAGVRAYLDAQVAAARDQGYVETLMGRRRYIHELNDRNWSVRQFGERVAQNTPIQGTAADLIKLAMLAVASGLREAAPDARLLLQVHDELVFEAPEAQIESLRAFVVRTMEGAMSLRIPLKVDTGVGPTWYDCK